MHGKAEVIIGKQRHGPTGTVQLAFEAQFTRFGNLARVPSAGTPRVTACDIASPPSGRQGAGARGRARRADDRSRSLRANWRALSALVAPAGMRRRHQGRRLRAGRGQVIPRRSPARVQDLLRCHASTKADRARGPARQPRSTSERLPCTPRAEAVPARLRLAPVLSSLEEVREWARGDGPRRRLGWRPPCTSIRA